MAELATIRKGLNEDEISALETMADMADDIHIGLWKSWDYSRLIDELNLTGLDEKGAKVVADYKRNSDEMWMATNVLRAAIGSANHKLHVTYDREPWGDCFKLLETEIKTQYGEALENVQKTSLEEAMRRLGMVKSDVREFKKWKMSQELAKIVTGLESEYNDLYSGMEKLHGAIEEAKGVFPKRENYAQQAGK